MKQLIRDLREFARERDWEKFHSPKNLAMALSVEVGELVEHFQWLTQGESYELGGEKLDEIEEEIGDILIYLTCLGDKFGIDPLEAAKQKLKKNGLRYPVEKSKGSAKKYNEL